MSEEHVPVLIVGAGGAGLSLSLLLLQQGVRSLLVERRPDISWHPRARNLNFRSLEVFRGLGLADEIQAVSAPVSRIFGRERLASGDQKELLDPASLLDSTAFSPEPAFRYCPQSRFEPILLAAARKGGADVRYNTELAAFTQDARGVRANIEDRAAGASYVIEADYLVGADGAYSRIRETLGIPVQGQGTLDEHYVFIYFKAAWDQLIRGYESDGFLIDNRDAQGMFLVAEKNLGMFILTYHPSRGESAEAFTRERCQRLLESAIGQADIEVQIVEVTPWQPAQSVAERFHTDRVFLVGDAAHTMPPKEGLGVNTAIQSAQNLGWKLAAVLQGHASVELLSTYDAERRPVGSFAAQHSLTGPAATLLDKIPEGQKASAFFPIIGYRYRSQAIVAGGADDTTDHQDIALLDRQELTGLPGTRVPHVWLERQSRRLSTLDLLDGGFVLLSGEEGAAWCEAAEVVTGRLGLRMSAYRIGPGRALAPVELGWPAQLGILADGAVLLRPDGFVAWRTGHSDSPTIARQTMLEQVFAQILGRSTDSPSPR